MDKDQWDALCADTTSKMCTSIDRYAIPIHKVIKNDGDEYGFHLGSGALLQLNILHALTNQHVLEHATSFQLAYIAKESEEIFALTRPMRGCSYPRDIAIAVAEQPVGSSSTPLTLEHFDTIHSTNYWELLFLMGFSGERSHFHFETLVAKSTSYLTQEWQDPINDPRFDPNFHFAIPYLPDKAQSESADTSSIGLPVPPGLSGSLVWNTNRMQARIDGNPWTPDMAKVCGIVWGWPSSVGLLYCTKVEHVLACINDDHLK